jgi:WD40 repeat protein
MSSLLDHFVAIPFSRRRGTGGHAAVNSFAFSLDGKMLAAASDDGTNILWHAATRRPIGQPLKDHLSEVLRTTSFSGTLPR